MMQTSRREFIGANIRATPRMPNRAVRHDLRIIKARCDAFVLQEFKLRDYWIVLAAIMRKSWGTFPSKARGALRPVASGQPCGWHKRLWEAKASRVRLLHDGKRKISESRWLRAVLLSDRETGIRVWIGGTHFVVHGDEDHDGPIRVDMLDGNIATTEDFLSGLVQTGHPIIFELDANIHRHSDSFNEFRDMVKLLGGRFIGEKGVEYLFIIDSENTRVEVLDEWTIPTTKLRTDHEVRGITYRLVGT
jgi:hypothetical protein